MSEWTPFDETKAEAWKRLDREGRWALFERRKKSLKRELGLHRGGKSDEELFRAVLREFPPLGPGEVHSLPEVEDEASEAPERPVAASEVEEVDLSVLAAKSGSTDFQADFEWVYGNIGNTSVTPEECPTGSAWHMLEWARESRAKFMELSMKFFASRSKDGDDEKLMEDDRRRQMGLIEQFGELSRVCPHCGGRLV